VNFLEKVFGALGFLRAAFYAWLAALCKIFTLNNLKK
jgi:hypothetical protein